MASHGAHHGLEMIARLLLWLVAASAVPSLPARAQAKKEADKPTSASDDDKGAAATKGAGVSDRDSIGFSQENAAAQMTELEERMFRLSEALAGLEPENSARLRLALKFSREEQILDQMRETFKLMKDAQLSKAETEVKELVAKLEHLRNLLLAEDLDFQLKLARLRQMRETLAQLDRIVKEERRELGWSRFAVEERKRLERYQARRPDLAGLIRDQQAVIADTKKTSGDKAKPALGDRAAIREREVKLQSAASALANDPLFADLQPSYLRRTPHSSRRGDKFAGRGRRRHRRRGRGQGARAAARRAQAPGRTGGTDRTNDCRRGVSASGRRSSQEPRQRPTPSRRTRRGWATSALLCEST